MIGRRVIPDTYSALERAVERYFYVAIAYIGVPFAALMLIAELYGDGLSLAEALLTAAPVVALAFYRLGPPTFFYRTAVALGLAAFSGTMQLLEQGPTFAAGAIFATAIVYPALFSSRELAFGALAYVLAALGLTAFSMHTFGTGELFPQGIPAEEWLRTGIGALLSFGFVVLIVSAIMQEHRRSLSDAAEAVALAEQERDARQQAQGAAERAQRLEALGRLAGGVAHDFNNALAVVLSNAELLEERELSASEVKRLASGIVQASKTAQSVAGQLAAFSRNAPTATASCSPSQVVDRLREPIGRLLPDDVSVRVHASSSRFVPLPEQQLEQILLNLIINARDAMTQNGGCIRFETRDLKNSTGGVALAVSDDGMGMSRETLSRAFEPFFTTKSPDKGTGLGLSMSHGLVTGVGGEICIESEPGRGTSVHIWLPEAEAPAVTHEAVAHPSRPSMFSGQALLVEDQEDVREALERLLARMGFEVLTREHGDAAIRDMPEGLVLLCTDAVMPGASVQQVIEAFQSANPAGRVLVCSGHLAEELEPRGIAARGYGFLAKPFTRAQLAEALEALFAKPELSARSAGA